MFGTIVRTSALICFGIVFATPSSPAALVSTTFTLIAPSAPSNELSLTLLDGMDTTQLSGTFQATLDIDQVTGTITSIDMTAGSIVTSDWNMTVTGIGAVVGSGINATVDTPTPPGGVTGTTFNATQHQVILNTGLVTAAGNPVQDFATTPLPIPGTGNGTITSTLNGGVFDISLDMPINSTQVVAGQNLLIVGNLVGTAQVTAVPEPSSVFVLALFAAGFGLVRKRVA